MILENKGKTFTIEFDSRSFPIPAGRFEVGETLGLHIMAIARKWGNTVHFISKELINPIIKKEEVIEKKPKETNPEQE